MKLTNDLSTILGVIMAIAFLVNIVVQLTKGIIPVPTKLWCIIVSVFVMATLLFVAVSMQLIKFNAGYIVLSVFGSFIVAFIAMYGFDTFKELWKRFKAGENINGDN